MGAGRMERLPVYSAHHEVPLSSHPSLQDHPCHQLILLVIIACHSSLLPSSNTANPHTIGNNNKLYVNHTVFRQDVQISCCTQAQ